MGIVRIIAFVLLPIFLSAQDWPRFELYQLKQGIDSGQFVTTGVDSNLDFNSVLRFRFQDSTLLIGFDTVITDATIVPILLATIDAGLGIEVNQVNGQIFIESLSIEDSIYNGSGSIIPKGTPLYASDTQGNYWDVAPARADDPSKMPVVAIAGEEIGIGEVGLGLIKGHIKQVNTTDLADGSQVYVGATGGYTSTKPTDEGVIIQRLGTVIKGDVEQGSGIINLGDEGFWNDYTSLTKLRDTLVLVRSSITTEISDSLTNYASRTELADSLDLYPNRTELGDTALAIRSDIPSLSGVVLTTTDQDIYGEKYFKNNIELDGALDMWINGNIYIGKYSGSDIRSTNVFDNVIIGTQAYFNGGYANDNTIIGDFAGYNTYGGGNVIIGASANDFYSPSVSVNVSNSVVLGYNANTSEETNTNSIVIGKDALGLGSNTAVIGNSSITKLNSNKYTFNVDQDTTGKDGQVLTFNSSSGEVELTQTGDVTTAQLADTALAIRADFPTQLDTSLFAWKADSIKVTSSTTDTDFPLIFSSATTTGYTDPLINSNLTYNPSTTELNLSSSELIVDNDGTGFSGTFKQTGTNNVTYSDGSVTGINTYYNGSEEILNIAGVSDDAYIFNPNQFGNIYIGTNVSGSPVTAISITDDREVGINRPTPSYTLDVNGESRISTLNSGKTIPVYHTSGVLGVNGSDIRIKKNIDKFENILNKVKQMNVVRFQYKSSGINDFGFIAQELMQPLPELVFQNESDGFYGVHYEKLGVISIKAIQEQQIIIESQDKRIRQLEEMVKQLIEKK